MQEDKTENSFLKTPYSKYNLFTKLLWEDLFNVWQFIAFLISILVLPLLSLFSTYFLVYCKNPFIESISIVDFGNIGIISFFSYSLIFPCVLSILISSFIPKELTEKTKLEGGYSEISYKAILLMKIVAIFTYGMILSFVSLFIFCLICYFFQLFYSIFSFFLLQFIYTLIILMFFESFTVLISSIINIPQKVRTLVIEFIIFIFLILTFIKPIILYSSEGYGLSIYKNFFLVYMDLNYHFGNIYLFLIQTNFNPSNSIRNFFLMLLIGNYPPLLYQIEIPGWLLDNKSYISPIFSIILIISLTILMKVITFRYFINRET